MTGWIGVLLVVAASGAMGISASLELRRRVRDLEEGLELSGRMRMEVCVRRLSLPQVLQVLAEAYPRRFPGRPGYSGRPAAGSVPAAVERRCAGYGALPRGRGAAGRFGGSPVPGRRAGTALPCARNGCVRLGRERPVYRRNGAGYIRLLG